MVLLKREKKWFADKNIQGIEEVMERRVQEYKLLRDQKYKLLRELKEWGKTMENGVIELDEDDGGNPNG